LRLAAGHLQVDPFVLLTEQLACCIIIFPEPPMTAEWLSDHLPWRAWLTMAKATRH